MQISQFNNGGSKVSKFAIVAALHVFAAVAVMNSMTIKIPKVTEPEVFHPHPVDPPTPTPPEPVEYEPIVSKPAPAIVVPDVVVAIQEPLLPPLLRTTTVVPDIEPVIIRPAPVQTDPVKVARHEAIRMAVLADGNSCVKPDYPPRAARAGDTGTVTLALLVGVDGRVSDSRIKKSSGSHELDRAAIAALSSCKFKPATSDGVPEQAWSQIAYVWTLEG